MLAHAGMFSIEEYLLRRFVFLKNYARTRPILQDCQTSLVSYTTTRKLFWWNQEGLSV
jgi:hypothetical protein